jgi:hypothetical protein
MEVHMKLTDVSKLPVTKDEEPSTVNELELARWAAGLSPDQIPAAIAHEWNDLQQVSSYVESQLEANRGLVEGIATQR